MATFQKFSRGTKRLNAKIKALGTNIRTKHSAEILEKGELFAKRIVPVDKGYLRNAIGYTVRERSGQIYVVQPKTKRRRPYHLWFHGIKAPSPSKGGGSGSGYDLRRGSYSPKSGVSTFMFHTADYMKEYSRKRLIEKTKQKFK